MSDDKAASAYEKAQVPNNLFTRMGALESELQLTKMSDLNADEAAQVFDESGFEERRIVDGNGVTRLLETFNDMYDEFGIHANWALFDQQGKPMIWGDSDTGVVNLTNVNFNGTKLGDALVTLNELGYVVQQKATVGSETRIARMGLVDNGTYPQLELEFSEPGGAVTIPNGDFASNDMSNWTTVQKGMTEAAVGDLASKVRKIVLDSAGNVYAALDVPSTSAVWKWDKGTNTWSPVGDLSGGNINDLIFDSGGNLYAAGESDELGTSAVWMWDGSVWVAVGALISAGGVGALAFDSSGNLYAGGGDLATSDVWKWDGATWAAVGTLSATYIGKLIFDTSGNLYAGGSMSTSAVWKWNGSTWAAVGTLSMATFSDMAFDGSGNLYVCGVYSGGSVNNVRYWNGSTWTAIGDVRQNVTWSLAFDGNGILYIGGQSNDGRYSAIRRLVDGVWYNVGKPNNLSRWFYEIVFDADGNLYGGMFAKLSADTSHVYSYTPQDWSAASGYAEVSSNVATAAFRSAARFAVTAGNTYNVKCRSYGTNSLPDTYSETLTLQMRFYNASSGGTLLSTATVFTRSGKVLAWAEREKGVTAPTGATYAELVAIGTTEGGTMTVAFDDFEVTAFTNQTILTLKDDNLYYRKNGVESAAVYTPPATTAANDFQVGNGAGSWIKKTLAEAKAILGITEANPSMLFAKGTSVSLSTSETIAFEVTLPANFFTSYHLEFEAMAFVINLATAGRSLTTKFYEAGSAVITKTQAMNVSDDNRFLVRGKMFKTGTNAQFAGFYIDRTYGAEAAQLYDGGYYASSLTEAGAITVKLTFTLSGTVSTGFLAGVKVMAVKNT